MRYVCLWLKELKESKEGTEERKEGEKMEEQQREQLYNVDTVLLERNQKEHFARAAPASNGDGNADVSTANHVPSAGIASMVRESSQQNGSTAAMRAPAGGPSASGPVSAQQQPDQQPVQQQQPGSREVSACAFVLCIPVLAPACSLLFLYCSC